MEQLPRETLNIPIIIDKLNEIVKFLNNRPNKFKPPTPQEVEAYAREYSVKRPNLNCKISGEKFCGSYEAKGWKVGKVPMKDWKAAVRNWCLNGWGIGGIASAEFKECYKHGCKAEGQAKWKETSGLTYYKCPEHGG